jgi:hypothetical protein
MPEITLLPLPALAAVIVKKDFKVGTGALGEARIAGHACHPCISSNCAGLLCTVCMHAGLPSHSPHL